MTGQFLHVAKHPHRCCPPDIYTHEPQPYPSPPVTTSLAEGTTWRCSCGGVKLVRWRPQQVYGNRVQMGGLVWRDETRRERRRRLGLRWWQRAAR